MQFKKSLLALAMSGLVLAGCGSESTTATSNKTEAPAEVAATQQSESEKANALFDQIFDEGIMRSPMMQTYLGIKKDYDKIKSSVNKSYLISKSNIKDKIQEGYFFEV